MKIIHTADWHIGKVLHKHSLQEEMDNFFLWLIDLIKEQHVDLLLVSGDVFDLANPGTKDRQVYYNFLSQLIGTNTNVIITGGNHDGIGVLNAPKELLNSLNINVIGGARENLKEEIIEVRNSRNEIKLVVGAVPFLRDRDLRKLDMQHNNRIDAIRDGIKIHYEKMGSLCQENYKNIPAIAMGHLYAKGVSVSDSERDIHIGNAASIESSVFPKYFGYVALGHIHRPQIIDKNEYIRYSGSPIPLSFSERKDTKGVLLLELKEGKILKPQFIEVPKQRELKRISGDFASIVSKLESYQPNYPLPSLVELNFEEENFSSSVLVKIDSVISEYSNNDKFKILKRIIQFKSGAKNTADLFKAGENIEDLNPLEVFNKRLENEELNPDQLSEMKDAFSDLLEMVQSEEA